MPPLLGMVWRTHKDDIALAFTGSLLWERNKMPTSPHGYQNEEEPKWLNNPNLPGFYQVRRNQKDYATPSLGPQSGKESKWLHYPCLLGVPKVGRNQSGYNTVAFSRSPKWGGTKVAKLPMPLVTPVVGRDANGYIIQVFCTSPRWGGIKVATSPLRDAILQTGK